MKEVRTGQADVWKQSFSGEGRTDRCPETEMQVASSRLSQSSRGLERSPERRRQGFLGEQAAVSSEDQEGHLVPVSRAVVGANQGFERVAVENRRQEARAGPGTRGADAGGRRCWLRSGWGQRLQDLLRGRCGCEEAGSKGGSPVWLCSRKMELPSPRGAVRGSAAGDRNTV